MQMLSNVDYMLMPTPLGEFIIATRDNAVKGGWFVGQKYYPRVTAENGWHENETPILREAATKLQGYFENKCAVFDLPLAPEGTEFQQKVWNALLNIPCGETTTYGQIAEKVAGRNAAQAVGAAVGQNPVSIIIPCHRVLGSSGSLTGYAGGLDRKRWLLDHEGAVGDLFG